MASGSKTVLESEEWRKAVDYAITDEDIGRQRQLIGYDEASKEREYVQTATHWDPVWAQAIGNPMAYDYGVMRENYLYHYLTDWAGDDGIVLSVHDEIRKFNYIGDTQTITGEVTGTRVEGDLNLVDVTARFTNQRGDETVRATATIALPHDGRPALYPEVPRDLQARATRMMARHWELSAAGV